MNKMKTNKIPLKPYSSADLSKVYNVCIRTMNKWLQPFHEEVGAKQGRYYTIAQVKVIFEKLGLPGEITLE